MRSLRPFLSAALALLLLAGCSQPESTPEAPAAPETTVSQPSDVPATPDVTPPSTPAEVPAEEPVTPEENTPSEPPTVIQINPEETLPTTSDEPLVSVGQLPAGQTSDQVRWTWFDDAVFIGDSVSLKLKNYVTKQRQSDSAYLGTAQFLTSGSLGSGNALWEVSSESVHPTFRGEKMLLEESIPLTGAKKIYLMLGTNDVGLYGIDGSIENLTTLLDRILASTPDASIYIQSATPICEGAEKKHLNNANLETYNAKLEALCEEKGYAFVNVASVLRDENGFLPREYCSDPDGMGIHFTDAACEIWIDYLCMDAANRL